MSDLIPTPSRLLFFLRAHQQAYYQSWLLLSLMCSPKTLPSSVHRSSECYVSCNKSVHLLSKLRLQGPGGTVRRREGGWCEIEATRLLAVPGRRMGHGHPVTSPDIPRCSRTSCGPSGWQARETQSHSMINHHTHCSMQLGSCWPTAEWLAIALQNTPLCIT